MVIRLRHELRDTSLDYLLEEAEEHRVDSDPGSREETDDDSKFETGDVVELCGLRNNIALNGTSGVIINPMAEDGRYEVDIGNRQIRVKETNMYLLGKKK